MKSQKHPDLAFEAINQAKEQGTNAYQCTETCRFGFDAIYEVKEQENECFIKSQKILFSIFMP